jgi:lipoprotein-releasing system ATP-binding protein
MSEAVLELRGIRKQYGGGAAPVVEVLHGIDLRLAAGEFAALVGPSGSGKSSLLNIMGLLDAPSSGDLAICGRAAATLGDAARTGLRNRYLGFVFQFHRLLSGFSALENVMLPMLAGRRWPTAAIRARAAELLERVGLSAHLDKKPVALSGGQQQRVAIVRALAMRPRLVLADEPTGNLDSQAADAVFALLQEINRRDGVSFLIVTHDPRLAQRCPRRVTIVDGRIASDHRDVPPSQSLTEESPS